MKYSALLILLMSTGIAQANTYFSNFYATGGLGGTMARFKINQDLEMNSPGNVFVSLPIHQKEEGTAAAGLLGLGYSHQFKSKIALAGEITAGLTGAKIAHRNVQTVSETAFILSSHLDAKLKNDFALLFKPGYVIHHKTQMYGLIGPRWGNFDSTLKSSYSATIGAPASGGAEDSASGYKLGFTLGLGLQRMLDEHFSASIEYAYTSYGEIERLRNVVDASPAFGSPGFETDQVKLSSSTNNLLAKFNYFF